MSLIKRLFNIKKTELNTSDSYDLSRTPSISNNKDDNNSVINNENFYEIISQRDKEIKKLAEIIHARDSEIDNLRKHLPLTNESYVLREEFNHLPYSAAAVQKLIDDYSFSTLIDIGAGAMSHAEVFALHGKTVTAVDFGVSIYYQKHKLNSGIEINKIIGDFNIINFTEQYDCAWASHVLEHQIDAGVFLKKVVSLVHEGGIIAITVPPLKHEIVGGHVSLWNSGLILYRLVLAGVDCSSAAILSTGYNISVIVTKKTISPVDVEFDSGDIRRIKAFLPENLEFNPNENDDPFNGNIARLNW